MRSDIAAVFNVHFCQMFWGMDSRREALVGIYSNVLFNSVVYVADKLIPCCTQSLWCREFTVWDKEGVYSGTSWCSSIPTPYFDGRAYVYKCFRNVSSVLLNVV
jgi:hypothetical protein